MLSIIHHCFDSKRGADFTNLSFASSSILIAQSVWDTGLMCLNSLPLDV